MGKFEPVKLTFVLILQMKKSLRQLLTWKWKLSANNIVNIDHGLIAGVRRTIFQNIFLEVTQSLTTSRFHSIGDEHSHHAGHICRAIKNGRTDDLK
jgi:hypothetical protein